MKVKGLALGFLFTATVWPAQIDQQYTGLFDNSFILEDTQSLGQSFRPSFTGALTGIDINAARHPDRFGLFNLQVRALQDPGDFSTAATFGPVLFSSNYPLSVIGTEFSMVHLPTDGQPLLAADQPYIVLFTTSVAALGGGLDPIAWNFSGAEPYTRGAAFNDRSQFFPNLPGWLPMAGDFLFQTHMIQVPEPTTIALGLTAALLLLARREIKSVP
jgi:hypothetical protein